MSTRKPIELTASRFASIVGADRHEITRKLSELNAKPLGTRNGGKLYGLRDLVNAHIGGDEKAERVRKLRCESERIEIQNARSRGELVEVALVKKLGEQVMAAVRNRILNMPLTDEEKDQCLKDLLSLQKIDFS